MTFNAKFWVPMILLQIVFGATVFTITRQYYIQDTNKVSVRMATPDQSTQELPGPIMNTDPKQLNSSTFSQLSNDDPAKISRQADEYFSKKQYGRAADLYQRLLVFDANNVATYNNLGITLHYLGKSTEAIRILNEGVAIDPTHQRSWLTLGFVYSQMGKIESARSALNTASKLGPGNEIGKSALKMLENLR